ncbi:ATP-binding protein [Nocardioides dongxiaopingii]|uniref:ATP-binding protein n=1 Tax=Nocardioides sp. S-1144 TaxID=2582905 RepID=UPI0011620D66|nr:ATP-binding protein [Nocardioides sp. S-1144]QCW50055.2 ATP-binding protein [Nocardioides sp. S-1144]
MADDGAPTVGASLVPLDVVARAALGDLVAAPGVHRAGLALTEGGGRRLRFTASDRTGVAVEWCHIDAYDDLPLTMTVRTGERVAGTLESLAPLFPDWIARQVDGPTAAVVAAPMVVHGQVLGGVLLQLESVEDLQPARRDALTAGVTALGERLRRAQLRSPREGAALSEEPVPDGVLVADLDVEGHPRAVGAARRFVRGRLGEWGVDDDTIDTVVLCLSEIVTNAVIHTGTASELRVTLEDGVLTTTVRDAGNHHGHRPTSGRDEAGATVLEEPLRVHGRGLQLVDALAARWGSEVDVVGTTVWFLAET